MFRISALLLLLGGSLSAAEPTSPAWKLLGNDRGKVAIVDSDGKVEWEYQTRFDGHELWQMPDGILLSLSPTVTAIVSPEKKVVWKYESKPKEGYKGRVEVHSFQPLPDGKIMIAESGNARIIEVDREGKITHQIALTVERPDAHRDTRMVRRLENGHYLVCHEGDSKVCEYDRAGKVVWSYKMELGGRPKSAGHGVEGHGTDVYGAIRLPSGNTLIGGGNNNRVLEVNPEGKIVWSLDHKELEGIQLAWVTTICVLPSGNIVVGNCHAGEKNPQLIEITKDKKVVRTFKDFKTFGNGLAATQILGLEGKVIR